MGPRQGKCSKAFGHFPGSFLAHPFSLFFSYLARRTTIAGKFPYCNFLFALHTFRITEFFRAQALKNMLNIE